MTVTLDLKPEIEAEVTRQANAQGVALSEQIDQLVAEALRRQPPSAQLSPEAQREKNRAAQAVLRQWREEDKTDDPEEATWRQAELDEFKAALNESHSSSRVIYP